MYVAVRVRAELTQDDQYHQELVMFRSASNISDLEDLRQCPSGPRTPVSSHEPEATVHQATSVPRTGTENEGVVPSWRKCEK